MAETNVTVRDSTGADIPRITEIYARSVREETASFELAPPDEAEMARRRKERLDSGCPYLVAEIGGRVVGYAYAGLFHGRPAYRWTVENTVYVDPQAQRRGVARKLMQELIGECTARGFRQMIAVIGGTKDTASVALHKSLGFTETGTNRSVGYKHGQWLDTHHLQLALGEGDTAPPDKAPGS